MNKLKLFSVTWATTTAGPSPFNNERTEVFFFGCKRATEGNPCKGCFNPKLWDSNIAEKEYDPIEVADHIAAMAPNKFITIGGGEPTDQMQQLIALTKRLKEHGFHILVYTWKSLSDIMINGHHEYKDFKQLLTNIDILVDGEFHLEQRLYKADKEDGLFNSIGSGNQIVWDAKSMNDMTCFGWIPMLHGYSLKDIDAIALRDNTELVWFLKDKNKDPEQITIHD